MNILYLSHLSGASYAGPTYSVPKQIEAQSKLDNVFWYNSVKNSNKEWKKYSYYHDLEEYPKESIAELPEPFNQPDIIVVELFYNMMKSPLIRELIKIDVPYIIIPRGELTVQGQSRKRLKKKIANILICKKYANRAAAIQYLTEQECRDSGNSWNKKYIIVPNGITSPPITKTEHSKEGIKCVSIGRIEPYQKGLDILIEACAEIKEQLISARCTITICGPDKEGKLKSLKSLVSNQGLEQIIKFHEAVFGKEKQEMLLNNDVFIIPSRFEGHPMALIEALSYGLPVIATTGSNMREEIEEYNAGWGSDNSVEGIRNAILKMINSDEYLQRSNNAVILSRKYEWDSLAIRAHDAFEQIRKEQK